MYLKACLKLCLVRLSLKRTTHSFKSKSVSLWALKFPGDWSETEGCTFMRASYCCKPHHPLCWVMCLQFWSYSFFFNDKYIVAYALKTSMLWKKKNNKKQTSRQISPAPFQNKTEINNPKPLQKQNTPLHLLLSAGERMTEQMYNRSYLCWLMHYRGDAER